MSRLFTTITAIISLAAAASAQIIPTELLTTTNDGNGSDVQSLLNSAGAGANVATDQFAVSTFFQSGDSMTWDYEWSRAGLAGQHRLGYYSVTNPSAICWVLGNVNQDGNQVTSWTGSIDGEFGMVLDNGIGNLFYSDASLNNDSLLSSTNPSLDGFDRRQHVAGFNASGSSDLFLTFEDLMNVNEVAAGGTLDYNDYGYRFAGTNPVPEPATMFTLGAAAIGFAAAKRRRKA